MSRILIVEDERTIRDELRRVLVRQGYEVVTAADIGAAMEADPSSMDLVLTDLRLPDGTGDVLIERAAPVPVLVMTAFGSISSAVEAMKRGAVDYLSKPFDPDELCLCVSRVLRERRLERRAEALQGDVDRSFAVKGIVGSCAAMLAVFERITRVAPTRATVLVLGEFGTGKELVARAIHAASPRASAPFIAVNCAAIPDTLVESELFGHEKGAFTGANAPRRGLFEAADGGTLFLDEIGELPPSAQARLLRVLQEGELRPVGASHTRKVDVRVIAATHRDLKVMSAEGAFRKDLYFRLEVVSIRLPALRERGDDVQELAAVLLRRACERQGRSALTLSPEARAALSAYRWPGNVRELENALERAVILHDSGPIPAEALGLPDLPSEPADEEAAGESLEEYFVRFVKEHEEELTETEIARRLGISRKTLWERRARLGIPRGRNRS